ncbi:MAG: hypothetical protein M0R06_10455, partial [Sphaerochaeta sp.]|nr:hypothetical protein [Sphaerochaeta sp.]
MTGGLNTAFLKNWSTPVELSPVSDTMTAGYTPELAEKGRTQVLRDKLLQLRDNLLQGMTAQELAGWGYNSEKSMKEAGIIKGNEYLDYNQTPIKPETVVKLRIQARPMSEYETMQTATGLKDPVGIMDFLNTPSMKAGDFDIAPADIINLAALAFGGVQALRGGQASFNRATFKSGLQREANARGVTLAKDEVDAVTGWAERNVKPSTLTKNGLNELYSKVFGYGKPVPPKYGTVPRTPPQPSALTQLTKTNTAVPGQTQSLVDILRGITGKVPATAQAAQGVVNLAGQPKQPWQMRQGEFIESALSEYTGSERATQRQFATESIKTTHRQTVEKALAEGKPVPESVLKDYPELQASTQQAVTKNQLNLLDELHNHSIRQKGSLQSTDDEIADYIRKLHDYVDKYAPRYMPKLQAAIRENEEGERTLASVGFDNVLNRLHEDAKYTIPSTQDAVAIASKARRNLFDVADQITQPSQPLSPSTSVQTGLAGIGPETAQAQMFGEVSGKTSSKQPLVDVERIKQQQAAPSEPIGLITPEPPPTPPAAPPIQPPSSGGQPPTPPTPPAQPVQPSNAPIPSGKGIEFGDLQDAETVARISFKQDISRKISNLPVIKQALKTLNPSSVASTPAEQGIVIRAVLRDEAKYKTQGIIAYLNKLGSQEKVFGKLDKNGLISSGVLKGKSVNDIRQYPDKYNLTKEQKAWVKAADD